MNQLLQQKLVNQFPWVGENFYTECNEGWDRLIWDMVTEIDDAYFNLGLESEIEILQIKEKFGMARVYYWYEYYRSENIGIDDIINKYERASKTTCELCGEQGDLIQINTWLAVRCEKCLSGKEY